MVSRTAWVRDLVVLKLVLKTSDFFYSKNALSAQFYAFFFFGNKGGLVSLTSVQEGACHTKAFNSCSAPNRKWRARTYFETEVQTGQRATQRRDEFRPKGAQPTTLTPVPTPRRSEFNHHHSGKTPLAGTFGVDSSLAAGTGKVTGYDDRLRVYSKNYPHTRTQRTPLNTLLTLKERKG